MYRSTVLSRGLIWSFVEMVQTPKYAWCHLGRQYSRRRDKKPKISHFAFPSPGCWESDRANCAFWDLSWAGFLRDSVITETSARDARAIGAWAFLPSFSPSLDSSCKPLGLEFLPDGYSPNDFCSLGSGKTVSSPSFFSSRHDNITTSFTLTCASINNPFHSLLIWNLWSEFCVLMT